MPRDGLIAARKRAAQQRYFDIEEATAELLGHLGKAATQLALQVAS